MTANMIFSLTGISDLQLYFCAKRYVRRPLVSTLNRRFEFQKRGEFFIGTHNESSNGSALTDGAPSEATERTASYHGRYKGVPGDGICMPLHKTPKPTWARVL